MLSQELALYNKCKSRRNPENAFNQEMKPAEQWWLTEEKARARELESMVSSCNSQTLSSLGFGGPSFNSTEIHK